MKFLILVLLLFNTKLVELIKKSTIPCKEFFIAQSCLESGWHKSKLAIKFNNYSGFRKKKYNKYQMLRFKSLEEYVKYSSNFFKRKNINNKKEYISYILKGKYVDIKKTKIYTYIKKVKWIENKIKTNNVK